MTIEKKGAISLGVHNTSEAYDLTKIERAGYQNTAESQKKRSEKKAENNVIKINPNAGQEIQTRPKRNPLKVFVTVTMTAVVACMLLTIVQCGVALNELNQQIQEENKTISEQLTVEHDLQLKLDAKFPNDVVQKYAEEKLGMVKASNAQKKFVNLAEKNQGKVVKDGDSNSVLDTILDAFKDVVS